MHRQVALVLLTLALAVPGVATADRAGPAMDLSLGLAVPPGADAEGGIYTRAGVGVQMKGVAAMLHGELFSLEPSDPTLDSTTLRGSGLGGSVRVELARSVSHYLQVQAGVSWRHLEGNEQVRRACDVFGTCAAGFYLEEPDYRDIAPWVAVSLGMRGKSRIWPGFGAQLGVGEMTIDRPGTGPDAHGVIIWLSAQFVIGTGR